MKKVLYATILITTFCTVSVTQVATRNVAPANGNIAIPSAEDYRIGAGDVLWVNVWHEPDFEIKSTFVRPDGKITINLLKDVQAAGLTPTQLGDLIEKGLKEKAYVTNPRVTVSVLEIRSQWVTILGSGIAKTQRYPLSGPLTVAELLAIAGGWADFAKTKEIKILRNGSAPMIFNFETFSQGKVDQNIPLRNGDIVVVQ